ncbi:tRNA glutamyl-Q(34) synthetase GluQRS [Martelella radicis]|uniref:Glutamyl-Q tRNA(Asp) synthetase n=1 Tax=Martelella radicis TaxID=1397476 RepID=A0A7W6PC89_9HYPH|nr:tRNA glutamyl-Q(34) synthetase GluQRS [Martelella radicis]MBB4124301.1 glutamyl-Q tRNA(Asp) synthetase [Martelella radicis]
MNQNHDRPVFRFAPSPNGRLHLGHALSALENERRAKAAGGRLLLRIEDIDRARCTPDLERGVIEDLRWLGIGFDGPVFRQSEHFADYQNMLQVLMDRNLAYPAFMTRGEVKRLVGESEASGTVWPRDPDGAPLYPDRDRGRSLQERQERLASGMRHAFRLDMEAAVNALEAPLFWMEETADGIVEVPAEPSAWGDIVLSRSDAPSSYHLSVVTDDAAQGVTHVVRGMDLYHATAVHRLLQALLGLPAPIYHHHRLMLDEDGRKLSKSNGDTALCELRANGVSPADIRVMCGF